MTTQPHHLVVRKVPVLDDDGVGTAVLLELDEEQFALSTGTAAKVGAGLIVAAADPARLPAADTKVDPMGTAALLALTALIAGLVMLALILATR